MSKPKVLIILEGGNISSIGTNMDMDIVVNDYDNPEEDQIWVESPDEIFNDGEAYKLIKPDGRFPLSMQEQLLREYLKDELF